MGAMAAYRKRDDTGCREETAAGVRVIRVDPPGEGLLLRLRCAWAVARRLRARRFRAGPDGEDEVVRWPDPGPVPVLAVREAAGIGAARLALAATGSPARLLAVYRRDEAPWDPRPWRRCDLVVARTPEAATALREAGVEARRIRVPAGSLEPVIRDLGHGPVDRMRRIDWRLR